MDKRALLAIALSFLVLILWQVYIAPKPVPPVPPSTTTGTTAATPPAAGGGEPARETIPAPEAAASGSPPVAAEKLPKREAPEGSPPAIIDTRFARLEITSVGARLDSWRLKEHQDYEGKPYELVSPDSESAGIYPFQFRLDDKPLEALLNHKARFDIERRTVTRPRTGTGAASSPGTASAGPSGAAVSSPALADESSISSGKSAAPSAARVDTASKAATGDGAVAADAKQMAGEAPAGAAADEVRLVYSDGQGLVAVKTFTYWNDSYLLDVSASITRNGHPVSGQILWGPSIGTPSAEDLTNRYYYGGRAIADFGTGATRYYAAKVATPVKLGDGLRWAGIEEQYFAAVFIPSDGLAGTEIVPMIVPALPVTGAASSAPPPDGKPIIRLCVAVPIGQTYTLFAGPKDYQLLSGLGRDLPELVNFAPSMPLIGPLVGVLAKLLWAALRWLHSYLPNYGLGIILLTTVIKILFYPVTQRAMVKMRGEQKKMQRVQPKVNAIKEKFKKSKDAASRAKSNEEIMALYKREGINPMASLGGCLPLLLQMPILYGFYSVLTVSIELRRAPFFGWIQDLSRQDPYFITPIVMGISMFAQQKLAMTKVTDPQQKAQQRMMMVMPLIFTWTFLHLPSGLVLYWFVNNILGIVQQVLINRQAQSIETAEGATAAGKA